MRRATHHCLTGSPTGGISIHALHEESDSDALHFGFGEVISIHALHEESDNVGVAQLYVVLISIHALHEESDLRCVWWAFANNCPFQSTLSMRRATDVAHFAVQKTDIISIHALHEESDNITFGCVYVAVGFQSTLSMRRATGVRVDIVARLNISIHALHEESDLVGKRTLRHPKFQSTLSMRRATLPSKVNSAPRSVFQSTLSMRRATFSHSS